MGGVVGAALACGVLLPNVYSLARFEGWKGFWAFPPGQPPAWRGAALVLVAVAALLACLPLEPRTLAEPSPAAHEGRWRVAGLLLLVPLCWMCASKAWTIDMPGDGNYWVARADSPFIMTSEPLGRWSHYLAYRLLSAFGEPSRREAVMCASVAAGCFQLSALLLLAPRVFGSVRRALPWLAYLFLTPLLIFNLGFPETTPWAYAFFMASLLSGLRYLQGPMNRPPWPAGLLLGLAIGAHGGASFAAGGYAVLLLVWLRSGGAGQRARSVLAPARLLLAGALAMLPFAFLLGTLLLATLFGTGNAEQKLFSNMLGGVDQRQWIAFSRSPDPRLVYAFLSGRYWQDLGNLFAAVCPVFPLAPLALIGIARQDRMRALYLGATVAGTLILAMFWNADYGMQRDFDLLSFFATPVYLSTACWLAQRLQSGLRAAFLAASIGLTALFCSVLPLVDFLPSSIANDQELSFGIGGDGVKYLGSGWSGPEGWGSWSVDSEAELVLPVNPQDLPSVVRIELDAYRLDSHPRQDVECWLNGTLAEAFHFGEGAGLRWQDVAIPAQALWRVRSTKKLQIVFKLLDAVSPRQLGISGDARKLGVALHYLQLSKHTNESQPLRVH